MDRAALAKDTLRIVEEGGYTAAGHTVSLRDAINAAKDGTRLYDLSVIEAPAPAMRTTAITVTAETTGEAIARLAKAKDGPLGALNFASAKNPGGGFLGGAQAQEEALARSSALYPSLLTQPAYYERNRANRSLLYLDLAIYSPQVPFFRTDAGLLYAPPSLCSVITCPAPNAGAVSSNQPHDLPQLAPVLRRRTEQVLAVAAAEKIERLILGAWGCGVFRNDPALVAATFAELLTGAGRFASAFSEVVFAIYDRTPEQRTFGAFQTRFAAQVPTHPQLEKLP
jgi:uncharacterized protein (TIGR02452 family)